MSNKYQPDQVVTFQGAKARIVSCLPCDPGCVPHYEVEVTRKRERPELHHISENNLLLPDTGD